MLICEHTADRVFLLVFTWLTMDKKPFLLSNPPSVWAISLFSSFLVLKMGTVSLSIL